MCLCVFGRTCTRACRVSTKLNVAMVSPHDHYEFSSQVSSRQALVALVPGDRDAWRKKTDTDKCVCDCV